MIRLFLDANVLFAASVSSQGGSAFLLESCRRPQDLEAAVSRLILLEAERNLRKKAPAEALKRYHHLLEEIPLLVMRSPTAREIHPYRSLIHEKDLPVLAAAILSRSSYLITLDRRDFMTEKIRKAHLPIRIATPKEFFKETRSLI